MRFRVALALLLALSCAHARPAADGGPFAVVLGIAQDGGYPQAGCRRDDCRAAWNDPAGRRHVAALAIVDPASGERWIIDATPDFPEQLNRLDEIAPVPATPGLAGILLTHAHIGHYTGLMHLGREVLGARGVPVYAMPRMREFLQHNGPWDQLLRLGNIALRPLEAGEEVRLNARITVVPLLVPHRDEYSETVGFVVRGPSHAILWLPDIDKWERWTTSLESALADVDMAYIDGTFYSASELPGRDLSQIPHPVMTETMDRLAAAPASVRSKVRFVHLNQSNPALRDRAIQSSIVKRGFAVAMEGERSSL